MRSQTNKRKSLNTKGETYEQSIFVIFFGLLSNLTHASDRSPMLEKMIEGDWECKKNVYRC